MKSSFILHIDSLCILDQLSDEQAGQLFKAIHQYQKTRELPELDALLALAVAPFLNQFQRDEIKYNAVAQRNRENGANGGRPPKNQQHKPKKPSGFSETQQNPENPEEPKKPDSDSVSDSDSEKDKLIPFEIFWDKYNYKKDRKDSEKAWNKLNQKDRQAAFDGIEVYSNSLKPWQEKRYPATYLNKRTWEDEQPQNVVVMGKIIRAIGVNENDYIVYEDGSCVPPGSYPDLELYKAGKLELSHFNRRTAW